MLYLSRWVEEKVVKKISSKEVENFVYKNVCCRHGVPLELLNDRVLGFCAELVDYLCTKFKIEHMYTTPYYPHCNGLHD